MSFYAWGSAWPDSAWADGTWSESGGGGGVTTVKGWGHKTIRRIMFIRPVRANPTPIVELGQTEDPT